MGRQRAVSPHVHPALLEACGDVRGLRALDLGCGEGWCARELARRGATVVGVDLSEQRIVAARRHGSRGAGQVDYHVMDAGHVHRAGWGSPFDLAVASMSLQEMREPGAVLAATRLVLRDGGRLVCSVPHPFAHPHDYFAVAARTPPGGRSGSGRGRPAVVWHRSVGAYVDLLTAAGFQVRDLREPAPAAGPDLAPVLIVVARAPVRPAEAAEGAPAGHPAH